MNITQSLARTAVENIELTFQKIDEANDPAIFISRFEDERLLEVARKIDEGGVNMPLRGVPFVVKDNIDVAGLPTTAGCPAWKYFPEYSAPVVQLLEKAGAICIGKTNMDQFATGLVGVRSPYGVPRNAYGDQWIPGGSSSGSAVAVARGIAAFGLGTDTAGSGRVPAAFNNLVGWKPTRGLLSARGVVPACRSLDCVSIFANNVSDVARLSKIVGVYDPGDAFARAGDQMPVAEVEGLRVGIPDLASLEFFEDKEYARLWQEAVVKLEKMGAKVRAIDFTVFLEAARLLYEGPWVAERLQVIQDLLRQSPAEVLGVTRTIIEGGSKYSAVDCFTAFERLAELKRESELVWEGVDVLCTPTVGTIYSVDEVAAEPIKTNSNLGYYTNFMNLLDLAAMAVPAGFRKDGAPFGITFIAPAFGDEQLMAVGGVFNNEEIDLDRESGWMEIAVCGGHMRGLPLNHQLTDLSGQFLREDATTEDYRFYALDEKRPGLVRVEENGASIELEVWRLPVENVGVFLAGIPAPLGLGKVNLRDGSSVCSFICEAAGAAGKTDISSHGSWRKYLEVLAKT